MCFFHLVTFQLQNSFKIFKSNVSKISADVSDIKIPSAWSVFRVKEDENVRCGKYFWYTYILKSYEDLSSGPPAAPAVVGKRWRPVNLERRKKYFELLNLGSIIEFRQNFGKISKSRVMENTSSKVAVIVQ